MEKYRSTADASTGVHPFIQAQDQTPVVARLACALFLFPLRILLVLVGAVPVCVLGFVSVVCELFSSILARTLLRTGHVVGLRLVLLGLGVWRYTPPSLERSRTRVSAPGILPGHGDVVFSNHSSYLDPLYLACAYSPSFAVASTSGQGVRSISLFEAVLSALCGTQCEGVGGEVLSLAHCASKARASRGGPLVLFAEGTTTNGRGVLIFPPQDLQLRNLQTFAIGLRYSASRAETHTVGSGIIRMLQKMASPSSEIRGRLVRVPVEGDMQRSVASLAGIPPLRLGAEAKLRYKNHLLDAGKGYQ